MTGSVTKFDNDAERLHFILASMRDAVGQSQGQGSWDGTGLIYQYPATRWFIEIADFPCSSYMEALEAIQFCCGLPSKVTSEVEALNTAVKKALLFSWVPNVNKALDMMAEELKGPIDELGGPRTAWPISHVIQPVNDTDLYSLDLCADLLRGKSADARLSNRLDEFSTLIQQLKDVLENDHNLSEALRDTLLRHVNAMILAIRQAEFWGMSVVYAAFAETLGDVVLKPSLIARSRSDDPTWKKVAEWITVMTAALSFGTATIQVVHPAQPAHIVVINEVPPASANQLHER
jgi:hypothetical protein